MSSTSIVRLPVIVSFKLALARTWVGFFCLGMASPTFALFTKFKYACRHCVVIRILWLTPGLWTFSFKALDLRTHLESWVRLLVLKMNPDQLFSCHRWLEVGREIGWSASLCQLSDPTTLEELLLPRVRARSQVHNLRIQRSRHWQWPMVTENISNNPLDQGAGHGQEGEHETQKNHFSDKACRGFSFAFWLLPLLISCCEGFEKAGRGRPTTGELASCIASNGCSMLFQRVPHPWLFIMSSLGQHFILISTSVWKSLSLSDSLLKASSKWYESLPCL